MKTIAGAHKELNGELGNAVLPSISDEFLFYSESKGFFICYNSIDTGNFSGCQYVCTVEEFNNYKGESMKTVMDAVNEFKGEWPSDSRYIVASKCRISNWRDDEDIRLLAREWEVISNEDQFNTLVQECSHHAGIELFNEYVKADKKLLEKESKVIDWSKAPDGADIYIEDGDDYTESFIKRVSVSGYYVMDMEDTCKKWVYQEAPQSLIDELISVGIHRPKPQPKESNMKPVFTQEMSDNGELPSAGMECMVQGYAYRSDTKDWFKVSVLGHYKGKLIAESCSEANRVELFDVFKPLDTRADKEKAIAAIGPYCIVKPEKLIDAIKAGEIHGVKWVGK